MRNVFCHQRLENSRELTVPGTNVAPKGLCFSSPAQRPGKTDGAVFPPRANGPTRRYLRLAPFFALLVLVAAGCQQKMADQPSYNKYEPNPFFKDGRSERPLVEGTVARGHLRIDNALFAGRKTGEGGLPLGASPPAVVQPEPGSPEAAQAIESQYADFVDEFPFPVTEKVLEHGQNRYTIYCLVCHDPLGTGQGKIVERGYDEPPSYHNERLRTVPVGHLFAVATQGYGSMPSYYQQIPVHDRWAVVAYIRALQLSQHFPEAELTDAMRQEQAEQEQIDQAPAEAEESAEGESP